MQKTHSQKLSTQDELISQDSESFSVIRLKNCCFSPGQCELEASAEETSPLFKLRTRKFSIKTQMNRFELDISSIQPSPTKVLSQNLNDLKEQILNLTQKFSSHQKDVKELTGENVMLKTRIIELQESLISICEVNAQNKSVCSCSVI
jgi:FtsZ-binding cell division protein ZapB